MHVDDTNDALVSQMAAYNDQNFTLLIKKSDGRVQVTRAERDCVCFWVQIKYQQQEICSM